MTGPGSAPVDEPDRPRRQPPAWEAPAIGLGAALAFAALAWWLARPPGPEAGRARFQRAAVDPDYARYVGDRSCRDCHPGESAAHSRSGHARTLRRAGRSEAAQRLDGRSVADPERPEVAWRFDLRDGAFSTTRSEAGRPERFPTEYALGSGRHASTFVTLVDRDPARPTLLEHRLTDFAHLGAPDLTPGQSEATRNPGLTPHGREIAGDDAIRCLGCHATATSDRGRSFLDEATMIPNVSCERCHGPARDHVEAARRGAPADELARAFAGPGPWSTGRQLAECGECHRVPEAVPAGEIRVDNAPLARHQPVGLMQSACFRASEGRLNCSTCHDPHARASTDRAAYEADCLACHGPSAKATCPVSPLDGCVGCHMPRRDVGRGMMMADHWIRVVPDLPRPSPPAPVE